MDSITCPECGRTSYHPMDISEGYCGACNDWTTFVPTPSEVEEAAREARRMERFDGR